MIMKTPKFNKIYVVESLRREDKKTGTDLYQDILRWRTKDLEKDSELLQVKSTQEFFEFFQKVEHEVLFAHVYPLIHLEIHGNKEGLHLSSGNFVEWDRLREKLVAINIGCKNNLLITLAVCEGAYLIDSIIPHLEGRAPFWGQIGPIHKVGEGDIAYSFHEFYDELLTSQDITKALTKLNNPLYEFNFCETIFKDGFKAYLDTYNSAKEKQRRTEILITRLKNVPAHQTSSVRDIRRAIKES
jgi:hypothetical protein